MDAGNQLFSDVKKIPWETVPGEGSPYHACPMRGAGHRSFGVLPTPNGGGLPQGLAGPLQAA